MPEGHVLHRAARMHGKKFKGKKVRAESPQGRFAEGAAQLDGQVVDKIYARGKHLFYRFETEDVLHIHLGLFGKFRMQTDPFPEPSENARLVISTKTDRIHLAGPTACEVLSPAEVVAVEKRLGPDPIVNPKDGAEQMAKALSRRSIPIGRALLDQKIISGLGNVYRAELLFLIGLHPFTPSNEVPAEKISELWDLSVSELKIGERSGRIVTVEPTEVGVKTRAKIVSGDRLYAYKRQSEPCRRCGDLIHAADIDGRNVWWCPTCQPKG